MLRGNSSRHPIAELLRAGGNDDQQLAGLLIFDLYIGRAKSHSLARCYLAIGGDCCFGCIFGQSFTSFLSDRGFGCFFGGSWGSHFWVME